MQSKLAVGSLVLFLLGGCGGGSGSSGPASSQFTYACTSTNCAFDGSLSADSAGTLSNYTWNFGDGANATGSQVTHNFTSNGTYNVSLLVGDGTNVGSSTQVVTISVPGTAAITSNCLGYSCGFSGNGSTQGGYGSPQSFAWDFGDGATSSNFYATHRYAGEGTYIVSLSITYNNGQTASVSSNITIGSTDTDVEIGLTSLQMMRAYSIAGMGTNALVQAVIPVLNANGPSGIGQDQTAAGPSDSGGSTVIWLCPGGGQLSYYLPWTDNNHNNVFDTGDVFTIDKLSSCKISSNYDPYSIYASTGSAIMGITQTGSVSYSWNPNELALQLPDANVFSQNLSPWAFTGTMTFAQNTPASGQNQLTMNSSQGNGIQVIGSDNKPHGNIYIDQLSLVTSNDARTINGAIGWSFGSSGNYYIAQASSSTPMTWTGAAPPSGSGNPTNGGMFCGGPCPPTNSGTSWTSPPPAPAALSPTPQAPSLPSYNDSLSSGPLTVSVYPNDSVYQTHPAGEQPSRVVTLLVQQGNIVITDTTGASITIPQASATVADVIHHCASPESGPECVP